MMFDVFSFKLSKHQAICLDYFVRLYYVRMFNVLCCAQCVTDSIVFTYMHLFLSTSLLLFYERYLPPSWSCYFKLTHSFRFPTEVGVVIRILLLQNICTIYLPLLGLYPEAQYPNVLSHAVLNRIHYIYTELCPKLLSKSSYPTYNCQNIR